MKKAEFLITLPGLKLIINDLRDSFVDSIKNSGDYDTCDDGYIDALDDVERMIKEQIEVKLK